MLKWAGGKRQLLKELRRFFPARIDCYYEPFLGSGAVFFDLCASGQLLPARAHLSDDNADLIGTYLRLRDSTDALLTKLAELAEAHQQSGRAHYYEVRDERFNPRRRAWLEGDGDPQRYPVELAAMLLYLNRTGYNGLFRLNAAGAFNVPAGRYTAPRIVHADRIRNAAALFANAAISRASFDETLLRPREGDVVYLDPPYAPLTKTANFRSYTAKGFGPEDQRRLCEHVVRLAKSDVQVVLSNSTSPDVIALYDTVTTRRVGLRCYRVRARRAINTNAARRGFIDELVVSNVTPSA